MARDPRWTVVVGGLLVVAAMIGATVVWLSGLPGAAEVVLLVVALVAAVAGWIATFRELSHPRHR